MVAPNGAVKTDIKAVLILENWLDENGTPSIGNTIRSCNTRCACGETKGYEANINDRDVNKIARVAVCHGCGDNDPFHDDVIQII